MSKVIRKKYHHRYKTFVGINLQEMKKAADEGRVKQNVFGRGKRKNPRTLTRCVVSTKVTGAPEEKGLTPQSEGRIPKKPKGPPPPCHDVHRRGERPWKEPSSAPRHSFVSKTSGFFLQPEGREVKD